METNSEPKNETYVGLCFWDFEDTTPDALTALIGVEPTRTYVKGAPRRTGTDVVWQMNGWRYEVSKDPFVPFEQ